MGESAGGQLAAVEALRGRFTGAVDLAGVVDPVAALSAPLAELGEAATRLVGCTLAACAGRWRDTQASTHLSARTPPLLVLHSTDDPVVPLSISTAFVADLHRAGHPAAPVVVPGSPHGL